MDKKKISLLMIFISIFPMMFTACMQHTEIDKVIFVRAVALDKSDKDGKIRITVESESSLPSAGKGETQKKASRYHSEGKTIFDANRNFSYFTERDIFWGHTKYIALGERAAREDVLKYLDFFIRNHENRLNVNVAVVRNEDAGEMLELSGMEVAHKEMAGIYENAGEVGVSKEILLSEFIEILSSKYSSAYLPCISIVKNTEDMGSHQRKSHLSLDGFAVFKGKKLLDFIIDGEARGLNWINGDVESTLIVVKDKKGNNVSLEVIGQEVNVKTSIKDGMPDIKVKVSVNSNIGELEGQTDVFDKESLLKLEKQQNDIVKGEIESVIAFAKENKVDIFGFGDKIFHQHPVKWDSIKDKWNKIFPEVKIEVEVESKISRVYNIQQPVRYWEEKTE